MTDPVAPIDTIRPKHLRLVITTDDFDDALRFYRDVLGLPEQIAFAADGADDRVAILPIESASIEIATPAHTRAIDAAENAPHDASPRIALQVSDTPAAVARTTADGRRQLAPATTTPFRSINARIAGPAGWNITFFQELDTQAQRAARGGFATDERRTG